MELTKTKFKQTEVGWIPEDWEICHFRDVADKNVKWSITGGPFGSNLKTSDYTDSGVQIIQLQNIGDGCFHDDSIIFTSEAKANELKSCNIFPDEIILSKMGDPVARACFVPKKAKRFLMASDGIRLVVDENRFSKYFVFTYINSKYFRNKAIEVSTGSTRQRIGLPKLKSITFVKPPLTEQKAIATALSDVDELIAKLEKLIEKKKAIKQGAMHALLTPPHKGGKRLDGFSGEWVETTLGQVCNIKKGQLITDSTRINGDIPVIAGGKTPAYYHNKPNRIGKTITVSGSGANAGYVSFHTYPIFASDCSTIEAQKENSIEFIPLYAIEFFSIAHNQSLT